MEHAAVTSLCNRTGVHIGGALQNAHTHNAPRVASAMWLRNGRGFSLQLTKPTIIILAERSNLTFTRSGAAASSLCLSHFSDFGGGRLSCDFEEENENFSEYSTVSKRPSPKQLSEYHETAKDKKFFVRQPKVLFSSFLCGTFACLFIAVTPASDECLDFGHPPAVIGILLRVCVCVC